MKNFLLFLLTLLSPHAPEDDAEDFEVEDIDLDEEDEPEEDEPEPKPSKGKTEQAKLRERAQAAEAREKAVREELERERAALRSPSKPNVEQTIFDEEERVLKDPNADEWQKYAVKSAREARAASREVAEVRRTSADMADKADFEKLATVKPKLYEKYSSKVEETLTAMRKNGNNAPRSELLALLIGRDIRDGKVKSTETKKKTERVTTPGVRSNVTAKGGATAAERRTKRLENLII